MKDTVVTLHSIDTVQNILHVLETGHHGFPILNKNGKVTGLIPRNFVITILKCKQFYNLSQNPDEALGLNMTSEDNSGSELSTSLKRDNSIVNKKAEYYK